MPEPIGELLFGDFSGSKSQDCKVCIFLTGGNFKSIHIKKHKRNYQGDALVSINKTMI